MSKKKIECVKIQTNGKPKLANMTKVEFNTFCKSILEFILQEKNK